MPIVRRPDPDAFLANPTARAIYEPIGYRAMSDFFHFDFVPAPRRQGAP